MTRRALLAAGLAALLPPARALAGGQCGCGHFNASGLESDCRAHMCPGGAHGNEYADLCGASGGGASGGAELGQALGNVGAQLLRHMLFGSPGERRRDAAEQEARRQWEERERRRLADERAREDEARYQRLRGQLLDFNEGPKLELMLDKPEGGGLQLMTGEEAEGPKQGSALAMLARAAAYSTLSAEAEEPEDAAELADAALLAALGESLRLPPPPPDVQGAPVTDATVAEFEPLKRRYVEARRELGVREKALRAAEEQRAFAAFWAREEERRFAIAKDKGKVATRRAQAKARLKNAEEERRKTQKAYASTVMGHVEAQLRDRLAALRREKDLRARKKDHSFHKGYQDAVFCLSPSSGNYCKGNAAKDSQAACAASYASGYDFGRKEAERMLKAAYELGKRHGDPAVNSQGVSPPPEYFPDASPDARGACRVPFVERYNRGFFQWDDELVAKPSFR